MSFSEPQEDPKRLLCSNPSFPVPIGHECAGIVRLFVPSTLEGRDEPMRLREGILQTGLGFCLDLSDPFPADPHALADVVESEHLAALKSKALREDRPLLLRQYRHRFPNESHVLLLDEF